MNKVDDAAKRSDELDSSILKSLFDSSPQGVLVIHDGEIIYTNGVLCQSIGIKPDDCIGQNVSKLAAILAPGFREEAFGRYTAMLSGDVKADKGLFEFTDNNDQKKFLDITSNTVTIGKQNYAIAYSIDATGDQISRETTPKELKSWS